MNTYTDSQRLAFLVSHSARLVLSDDECWSVRHRVRDIEVPFLIADPQYKDYRNAIDACIRTWESKLDAISMGVDMPSREPRRFANAQNPGGLK